MEHEVSHSSTCKSVFDPRTSSTREGRKMRDNLSGEPTLKKKDHGKGPIRWKEASCKGYTFCHRIECTATTLSAALMRK